MFPVEPSKLCELAFEEEDKKIQSAAANFGEKPTEKECVCIAMIGTVFMMTNLKAHIESFFSKANGIDLDTICIDSL